MVSGYLGNLKWAHFNKFNLISNLIFFISVELELENEHGEFLEQCKSHFVDIESKSYKLRQEIRRLRIEMGLPTFHSQERKVYFQKHKL